MKSFEKREFDDAKKSIRLLQRFNMAGRCFLDCGANVGWVTQAAAARFDKVIAVEAHPKTFQRLKQRVKSGTLNLAVTGRTGDNLFISTPKSSIGATVAVKKRRKLKGYYKEVQSISLNDLIRHYKPDCIKLDIEGSEYDALEKAKLDRVQWIICEFHGTRGPARYKRFVQIHKGLIEKGFKRLYPDTINLLPDKSAAKSFFFLTVYKKGAQ